MVHSKNFVNARKTIDAMLKKPQFHNNPDLLLMRAKIDFKDPEASKAQVLTRINEAYKKGQRKEILFDIWFELEGDNVSAKIDIASRALDSFKNDNTWRFRFAEANLDKGERAESLQKRIEYMATAQETLGEIIKNVRKPHEKTFYQDKSKLVNDGMYNYCREERNFELGARCAISAIENGDVRTENFTNATFCLKALSKIVSNLSIPDSKRRKIYAVLDQALINFDGLVHAKLSERGMLRDQLVQEIELISEESIYPYQFDLGKSKAKPSITKGT